MAADNKVMPMSKLSAEGKVQQVTHQPVSAETGWLLRVGGQDTPRFLAVIVLTAHQGEEHTWG